MTQVKQISDNEIYLLIKYTKSVLWRVANRLSYIEEARFLKVNQFLVSTCRSREYNARINFHILCAVKSW